MREVEIAELLFVNEQLDRLARGQPSEELEVLGTGEFTCVVGYAGLAWKRMPPYRSAEQARAYASLIYEYIGVLKNAGLNVIESRFVWTELDEGLTLGFVVQPELRPASLLSTWVRNHPGELGLTWISRVFEHARACVSSSVGFDPQLSNWAIVDNELVFFDVTTPLLRDEDGRNRLDAEVFLSVLPTGIRGLVRLLFVDSLIARFHDLRQVALDLVANIANYQLAHLTPEILELVNKGVTPALSPREVRRYRIKEAITWALIHRFVELEQAVRRILRLPGPPVLLPWRNQPDTLGPDTPRPDTPRPDTLGPDTLGPE